MSLLQDVADGVVSTINAGTYSAPFDGGITSTRTYRPETKREDLGSLVVSVVQAPKRSDLRWRNASSSQQLQIYVGIAKAADFTSNTEPDQLDDLCEEIETVLKANRSQAGCSLAVIEYASPDKIYSDDYARQHDVFYAVMLLTFNATRT